MSERQVSPDYELRGQEFEVWTDGSRGSGGYPNWWIVARAAAAAACKVPQDTDLTGAEFDPPLTDAEVTRISEHVYETLAG